jgi:hypothetical protein
MVQIAGDRSEAFLYDVTGKNSVFLRTLGPDADRVRFSGGAAGQPLQILVDRADGTFSLYNEDGALISSSPAPAAP